MQGNLPIAMLMHLTKGAPGFDMRFFLNAEIYVMRGLDPDGSPTDHWHVYHGDIYDNDVHEGKKHGRFLYTIDSHQLLVFIAHKTLWESILHSESTEA